MSWCTLPMLLLRPAYCSGIQPPIILITSTYTPKASINSMEPQNDNFQHKSPFPEADRRPQNEARLPSQMLRWDPTVQHPQYTNYSWWLQSIWTLDIQCDTIGTSDVLIQRSEWSCHLNTRYIYIYTSFAAAIDTVSRQGMSTAQPQVPLSTVQLPRFRTVSSDMQLVAFHFKGPGAVQMSKSPWCSRDHCGLNQAAHKISYEKHQDDHMMIIYDHVYIQYICNIWLYMIIYDYIWLYMIMYDYVWLCMIILDYIWLRIYDYIWLWMIIYSTITYTLLNKKDIFPSKRVRFLLPCFHVIQSTNVRENHHGIGGCTGKVQRNTARRLGGNYPFSRGQSSTKCRIFNCLGE